MPKSYNLPAAEREVVWEMFDGVLDILEDHDTETIRQYYEKITVLLALGGAHLASRVMEMPPDKLFASKHAAAYALKQRGADDLHTISSAECLVCPLVAMCPAYLAWADRREDLGNWGAFAGTYDLTDWVDEDCPEEEDLHKPPLLPPVEERRREIVARLEAEEEVAAGD